MVQRTNIALVCLSLCVYCSFFRIEFKCPIFQSIRIFIVLVSFCLVCALFFRGVIDDARVYCPNAIRYMYHVSLYIYKLILIDWLVLRKYTLVLASGLAIMYDSENWIDAINLQKSNYFICSLNVTLIVHRMQFAIASS